MQHIATEYSVMQAQKDTQASFPTLSVHDPNRDEFNSSETLPHKQSHFQSDYYEEP